MTTGDPGDVGVDERRCSRCRAVFPAGASTANARRAEWWLCAPCHDKLIGPASKVRA